MEAKELIFKIIEWPDFYPGIIDFYDEDDIERLANWLGIEPTDYFFDEGWDNICDAWEAYRAIKFACDQIGIHQEKFRELYFLYDPMKVEIR